MHTLETKNINLISFVPRLKTADDTIFGLLIVIILIV